MIDKDFSYGGLHLDNIYIIQVSSSEDMTVKTAVVGQPGQKGGVILIRPLLGTTGIVVSGLKGVL